MSLPLRRPCTRISWAAAWIPLASALLHGQTVEEPPRRPLYEQAPINYSQRTPQDAIARLARRSAAGELAFAGTDLEILRAVLRELHVSAASQVAVFSKTSMQSNLIDSHHPRVLYFSDSIYVGWVPGGLIEAVAIDPELGPIFYAFDPQDARDARRTFVRESSCLRCHANDAGRDIPALFAQSVIASAQGEVFGTHRQRVVTSEATAFTQRWGGWYVTGYAGLPDHRGNTFGVSQDGKVDFTPGAERHLELPHYFDTSPYLAKTSDATALLVLQHQLDMHNCLTRAAHRSRRTLDAPDKHTDELLAEIADDVVDHLLFRQAAWLPPGIVPDEGFRHAFAQDVPRTRNGNSLKDFAAKERLFANRCSFLIYSESFASLPLSLKDLIYTRLHAALADDSGNGNYSYLEANERHRIMTILAETLPDTSFRRLFASP